MRRILVVDDDRAILEGLRALLVEAGFAVEAAADFGRAAELLLHSRFDLLITDLDLPGGNGLDLVRMARTYHRGLGSILITGFGCSEVRRQVEELCLVGYFEKPFDPRDLLELVRSWLANLPARRGMHPESPEAGRNLSPDERRRKSPPGKPPALSKERPRRKEERT